MNPKTGEVSDTPVEMMDVYQEFNELSEKFKIMKFKSKVRRRQTAVHSCGKKNHHNITCRLFFLYAES